jgi:hypothetical protein
VIPKNIDDVIDDLKKEILETEKQSVAALNGRKNGLLIKKCNKNQELLLMSQIYLASFYSL